jgi:hypothetical protein
MIDLIKLRDRHVHPRIVTHPVSKTTTADISIKVELPKTYTLKMAPLGMAWSLNDAIEAINTVLHFLRLFFQLTTVSLKGIQNILSDNIKCKDGIRNADTGRYNDILKLAKTIGVDVSFLLDCY